MTSLAISDVPWISKRIKACCRRAKLFSTDELLLSHPQQLQQALRISPAEVDLLVLQVATASAPPPISVLDSLNGKPPSPLDHDLFHIDRNDTDSDQDSDDSDNDRNGIDDVRLPSSTIIPPTQGYDGNFPGVDRYVYETDSDSDSESNVRSDADMHDDVEMPSTYRSRPTNTEATDQYEEAEGSDANDKTIESNSAMPIMTRDVLSLGRDRHFLTTGSNELDELLRGGFRSSLLTELVGESGSGKTQIAIQACTFAALGFMPLTPDGATEESPRNMHSYTDEDDLRDVLQGFGMASWSDLIAAHSGIGVCFITSGGERGAHSIVDRALELAEHAVRERFQRVHLVHEAEGSQDPLDREILLARAIELGREQVLRNLHVACVADVEALEHALKYSLPGLISRLATQAAKHSNQTDNVHTPSPEIGMIVVDNLPSLFQEDPTAGDIDSLVTRSKMLVEIAESLKRLAAPDPQRHLPQHSAGAQRDRTAAAQSSKSSSAGRAVLVLNHVSDAFGIDKDIARRFVFDSADRIRLSRSQRQSGDSRLPHLPESVFPDNPVSMDYASQSAFVSGLLASVPPTLAEAISSSAARADGGSNDGPLYVLNPRTAQLGHTWTNLINVRVFLSKTRGRIAMPQHASSCSDPASTNNDSKPAHSMTTVRKAAVVLNPFGPTMLDAPRSPASSARKTTARQLRFVITPSKAVHALTPYAITNTAQTSTADLATSASTASSVLPPTSQPPSSGQIAGEGDEEEFMSEFDLLEEHHLLAIDRFEESFPNTPVS